MRCVELQQPLGDSAEGTQRKRSHLVVQNEGATTLGQFEL